MSRFVSRLSVVLCLAAGFFPVLAIAAERTTDSVETVERRLADAAKYLASDELEGRGVGTKGLDMAADYLAAEFAKIGLKTKLFKDSPFQTFTVTTHTELGPKEQNRLTLTGPRAAAGKQPQRIELRLGQDFNPLALGGSGEFDVPIVFVGYGITDKSDGKGDAKEAKSEDYDDYAGVDVKGKAVLILRKFPQQKDPKARFAGAHGQPSRHATFATKVSNAYQHGAALAIIVNDSAEIAKQVEQQPKLRPQRLKEWEAAIEDLAKARDQFRQTANPTPEQLEQHRQRIERLADEVKLRGEKLKGDYEPLLGFSEVGTDSGGRKMPVVFCSRAVADRLLKASIDIDVAALETQIDNGPTPKSAALGQWRIAGETALVRKEAQIKNVVAVLEGEGPLADETIVIGAHYDHLGRGGSGSLSRGSDEIHNGADDNASGAAVLVEIARRLATREKKLGRRMVLIAFTGEERGLLGSAHYVQNPLFPLDKAVAMLNLDMVGRLKDDGLIVYGTGTAAELDGLLENLNGQYKFKLTKHPSGFGPSDHSSFYARKIPAMHFFTGTHADYHRPGDDADKLNVPGMRRIGELVADMAARLADTQARPQYLATKQPAASSGGSRPYFGSIPEFNQAAEGYPISGVTKDSPAEQAGVKAGDLIIQLGPNKIGNLEDFDAALRKFKAGDKVALVVRRGGQSVTLEVTLDPPR